MKRVINKVTDVMIVDNLKYVVEVKEDVMNDACMSAGAGRVIQATSERHARSRVHSSCCPRVCTARSRLRSLSSLSTTHLLVMTQCHYQRLIFSLWHCVILSWCAEVCPHCQRLISLWHSVILSRCADYVVYCCCVSEQRLTLSLHVAEPHFNKSW